MSRARVVLAAAVLFGAVGCAGELESPERFSSSCAAGAVEQIFTEKCGGQCHGGDAPMAGLDLTSADAAGRLLGAVSATQACGGAIMIDPDAPGASLLLDKLGDAPSCGSRMPFGANPLSASDLACVEQWVEDAVATQAEAP